MKLAALITCLVIGCLALDYSIWHEPRLALIIALVVPWIAAMIFFASFLEQQWQARIRLIEQMREHERQVNERYWADRWRDISEQISSHHRSDSEEQVH